MIHNIRQSSPDALEMRTRLEESGISSLLSAVLVARGIQTVAEANRLLSPEKECLHDPCLMRDMDVAVARIRQAMGTGERVVVYGDYDVDGITSTSLLTAFLRGEGIEVLPYIPCRTEEGYGLNGGAVRQLASCGTTLIITVDCGITAVDEVDLARSLGMDVIITDHHACKEILPRAVAVVDPHRPDCPYPFKGLAGVGVALKVALAVAGQARYEEILNRYVSLVALGTIADVMPMIGENRNLVHSGLASINKNPSVGLGILIKEAGLGDKLLTTVGVGYTLAPRINASGRMGRADLAVELLLTDDPVRSHAVAVQLCELNRERQQVEGEILAQCIAQLEQNPQKGAIILADYGWHQGVVGIVASRLSEKYGLPTFIVCMVDGVGKGSCRSWGGVNLFALLDSGKEYLAGFGGHALAAGFTIAEDQLEGLRTHLCARVGDFVTAGEETGLVLDYSVAPWELTVDAIDQLERLEPCGNGNPRPRLQLAGATVRQANPVGQGRHLKLRLERDGVMLDAIWFSVGTQTLAVGSRVDVAFYPQVNEFRGLRNTQLQVMDLVLSPQRDIYSKYRRGEALTADELENFIPNRDLFVRIWRYLKKKSTETAVICDTVECLCFAICDGDANSAQIKLCLDVMAERGLIDLCSDIKGLTIHLNEMDGKVKLEDSIILRRLRATAQQLAR